MTANVDPGTASVSHVAGPPLELDDEQHRLAVTTSIEATGRRRAQRCAWCGVDLVGLRTAPGSTSRACPSSVHSSSRDGSSPPGG